MRSDYENKAVQLNKPLRGYPAGHVMNIKVDRSNNPKDKYWRDRFKDAKIDGCMEFVKSTPAKKKTAEVKNNAD